MPFAARRASRFGTPQDSISIAVPAQPLGLFRGKSGLGRLDSEMTADERRKRRMEAAGDA